MDFRDQNRKITCFLHYFEYTQKEISTWSGKKQCCFCCRKQQQMLLKISDLVKEGLSSLQIFLWHPGTSWSLRNPDFSKKFRKIRETHADPPPWSPYCVLYIEMDMSKGLSGVPFGHVFFFKLRVFYLSVVEKFQTRRLKAEIVYFQKIKFSRTVEYYTAVEYSTNFHLWTKITV